MNLYATPVQLRSDFALGESSSAMDDLVEILLDGVSRQVDRHCNRRFYVELDTIQFPSPNAGSGDVLAPVRDLISVTTLRVDATGQGDYETWADTDYFLGPARARPTRIDGRPYTSVHVDPGGTKSVLGLGRRGVEIAGKWGWSDVTTTVASLVDGAVAAGATTVVVDSGADFSRGETLLIDSEQLYVRGITGNNLTVERGANGTIDASHADNASIARYVYPAAVVQAVLIQAGRTWERVKPTIDVRVPDIPAEIVLDPDVARLLTGYVRLPV